MPAPHAVMLEAAYQGLMDILEPQAMMLMVGGVLLSSVFAALPGVGVLLILTVVLPFSLTMSPYHAIAFLLGIGAVSNSGKAPIKGLIAAILGILIATVGVDEKTAIERFSLDTAYLWDGVNVILIGLGLFAVPELIDLSVRRSSISETEELGSGLVEGIKDVFRHWWLVVRCSAIGVWVGVLPGLGSSVADWFAYAHAVQTEKHSERFGTGDVRGVIAPENSNNAKEGGALIPTIAFGIPGSTSLAIILAAFVSVGIYPGSRMLTDQLHLTLAMVWVLVLSNLMATSLAMGFAETFARLSLQPSTSSCRSP